MDTQYERCTQHGANNTMNKSTAPVGFVFYRLNDGTWKAWLNADGSLKKVFIYLHKRGGEAFVDSHGNWRYFNGIKGEERLKYVLEDEYLKTIDYEDGRVWVNGLPVL